MIVLFVIGLALQGFNLIVPTLSSDSRRLTVVCNLINAVALRLRR